MKKRHIGDQIKTLRLQHGQTLKELGEEIEFNYSNLSKIERGIRKPTVEFLERLTNYYKVDISYFFDVDNKDPSKMVAMDMDWFMLSQEMKSKNVSFDELKTMADTIAKIKNYNTQD
ncbi:helix-turn-helix domain-containing protein [Bacillus timonensis]|uniref:helix-turn-helix domain-containing protein n=1 Tax=Bacillus timonensis TaxID=1033734 RepID=UPI00028A0D9E|nr:helix-turn-helix transcriptional regulator [Bacillus timonensis]